MLPGIYDSFQHWGEKHQTVWIYSDPHFNDDELAGGIKGRPSAEEQVKKINAKCGRRDCFICLGDVGDVEYVRQIRADYKVLIMGNHDAGSSNYKRQVVKEIYDQDEYSRDEVLEIMRAKYPNWKISIYESYEFHSPFKRWNVSADNLLFDEVYEGALIIGEKLILSHEPIDMPCFFNIHGHDHAGRKRQNHLNVCSDVIRWEPVHLNQFLKSGFASKIDSIHRETIDRATERKAKRGGKTIAEAKKEKEKTCATCACGKGPLSAGGVRGKCHCTRTRMYEKSTHYCAEWKERKKCQ
jgi:calcineurin-like phosphoesterase family protein